MSAKIPQVGSYKTFQTEGVRSYRAYEKDFTSPGQFIEEDAENEISLMVQLWPGAYDGEKWFSTGATDDDAYAIAIYYKNKYQVDIMFDASYGQLEHLQKSFDFVKEAAKIFFLVNDSVVADKKKSGRQKIGLFEEPGWEKIEQLMSEYKNGPVEDIRDGNGWCKTMSVEEAKELFSYLKITVDFPS